MIVSIGSLGPIISAWIYLPSDGYVYFPCTSLDITKRATLSSIYSPRYIKALSVQLGAQVAIVLLAVRSLTLISLWKGHLPAVETRRYSSLSGSCARTSFVAQERGTTDSKRTRRPLQSSATDIQSSASPSKGPPAFREIYSLTGNDKDDEVKSNSRRHVAIKIQRSPDGRMDTRRTYQSNTVSL